MTFIIICIVFTIVVVLFEMKNEFRKTHYHNKIKKIENNNNFSEMFFLTFFSAQ